MVQFISWEVFTVLSTRVADVVYRLETEEQARQKLQLEKVAMETKMKKQEEAISQYEATSAKVCMLHLIYYNQYS